MKKKRTIIVAVSVAAAVVVGVGGVAVANWLLNQPTEYAITYEIKGLSGGETIRYQANEYSDGLIVGTSELQEKQTTATTGEMDIEAIVTEGHEASVSIELTNPSGMMCAIVQDNGDAKLEKVVADQPVLDGGAVTCKATLQ